MVDTRQRILDTARELFNEQGLSRVGVRDIARAVEMSPGNLAYHFPTKDDLVTALVLELHDLDRRTIFAELPPELTPGALYQSAVAVMRNILAYRFILLSYVEAVRSSAQLQQLTAELRVKRRERHDQLLEGLIRGGYLDRRRIAARTDYLFEQAEMISSGWLKSATLQGWNDDEAVVLYYAKVGMVLLEPYGTPKGVREIRRIVAGKFDPRPAPKARTKARAASTRKERP